MKSFRLVLLFTCLSISNCFPNSQIDNNQHTIPSLEEAFWGDTGLIIGKMVQQVGLSDSEARAALSLMIGHITGRLSRGEEVSLDYFGTFRRTRNKNIDKGDPEYSVGFFPGGLLLDALNSDE